MKLMINFILSLCLCQSLFYETSAYDLDTHVGNAVELHSSRHHAQQEVHLVTFYVYGDNYSFKFERSNRQVCSNDVPVWLVNSRPGNSPNYTYERVPDTEQVLSSGDFYVDNAMNAVVFVHQNKNNDTLYDGVFEKQARVRSIRSLSEEQKLELQGSQQKGNHVISRVRRSLLNPFSEKEEKKRSRRSVDDNNDKLDKPLDVLYPKLLIVVDHYLFHRKLRGDVAATIRYVATFWNKIDQKYTELDSIDIQLSVTGIIIANDERAFNYIYQSRVGFDETYADPFKMIKNMGVFFHNNFANDVNFQNYDEIVLMTWLAFKGVKGITYEGNICSDIYNSIIVTDEGHFEGTLTATHELAHALGVAHDERDSECQVYDDNDGASIMYSYVIDTYARRFFWSDCSKKQLKKFTTLKKAECLATRQRKRHNNE